MRSASLLVAASLQAACAQILGFESPRLGTDAGPLVPGLDAGPACTTGLVDPFGIRTQVDANPRRIAAGDLDHDGFADVVLAYDDLGYLTIWHGKGTGELNRPQNVSLRSAEERIQLVVVGDVDGDGFDDLVVASSGAKPLLYRQDRSAPGQFLPPLELGSASFGTQELQLGDVDGDGVLDLLVVDAFTTGLRVLLHDPGAPGTFRELFVETGGQLRSPHAHDIDGDGAPDLAVMVGNRGQIMYQDPLDPGVFSAPLPMGPTDSSAITVARLDGDAVPDIIVAQFADARVFRQDPAMPRTFVAGATLRHPQGGGLYTMDINGDARDDLASNLGWLLQCEPPRPAGTFAEAPVSFGSSTAAFIDLNGDGRADAIQGTPFGYIEVHVWE
jgi:hypothetical protein